MIFQDCDTSAEKTEREHDQTPLSYDPSEDNQNCSVVEVAIPIPASSLNQSSKNSTSNHVPSFKQASDKLKRSSTKDSPIIKLTNFLTNTESPTQHNENDFNYSDECEVQIHIDD